MARNSTAAKHRAENGAARSKRETILDAAARVFLDCGYGDASMDAVAREAGVAKQTIYSYFDGKDALFEAIVRDKCDQLLEPIAMPEARGNDPETALARTARRFLDVVLAPEGMALFRALVAECGRFPNLAEAFYRSGPLLAAGNLADYLAELDRKGILKVDDPLRAARLFFALLRGDLYIRRLLDLDSEPKAAEVERAVADAVRVFLAAHARS